MGCDASRLSPCTCIFAGYLTPIITITMVTSSSVSFSVSLQQYSSPVDSYAVSVFRVTGSSQVLCESVTDVKRSVTLRGQSVSRTVTGLEQFSVYRVRAVAKFTRFNTATKTTTKDFTTISEGMPKNLHYHYTVYIPNIRGY